MRKKFVIYFCLFAIVTSCSRPRTDKERSIFSDASRVALDSAIYFIDIVKDDLQAKNWLSISDSLATLDSDMQRKSDVLVNLGWMFHRDFQYDSAIFYYSKSLMIAEVIENSPMLIDRYLRLARVYRSSSQFSLAAGKLEAGLSLSEKMKNSSNIALFSNRLGNILSAIEKSEEAKNYYQRAANIWKQDSDKIVSYSIVLHNIGSILNDLDSPVKALPILYRALEIKDSLGREESMAYTYSVLGSSYRRLDSLNKARSMFLKSLEIRERHGDKPGIANVSMRVGRIDILEGALRSASSNLNRAERLAIEVGNPELLRTILEEKKKLYKASNRLEEWIATDEIFDVLTDSIQREQRLKVQEVQSAAELQREQQKTALAEQGAQIARLEADSERQKGELRLYLGLVALLGVMLAGWQLWQIRKRNAALVTLNSRIRLITDNAFHSQKNALGLISALLRSKARQSAHDKELEVLRDVEGKIEALGGVAKYLFQTRLNDNTEVAASIQLATYLESLIQDTFSSVASDMAKLKMKLEDILVSSSEALNIGLIANEAVTNFSKYSEAFGGDQLEIETKHQEGSLFFQIKDNGPGFPEDFKISTSGGFGMQMMSNLVDDMGGALSMLRQDGWTLIQINIPLKV